VAENAELVPVPDQDLEQAVFRAWEAGKAPRVLSREFALTLTEVERILDRMLPAFDGQHQLRAFKRELQRLEDLSGEFFALAKRDHDRDSAHLVARLNERICAMRGWSPVNIRMDPLTVQAQEAPRSFDRVRQAIYQCARGSSAPGDGPSQDGNGTHRGSGEH
jgi:hypothetical protein